MSVGPSDLMSEAWTRWQGRVINDAFPIGRLIGCSDHSGVFATKSVSFGATELALKLVPTDRALAEALLRRWKRSGGITHPNLLRLLQWGGCQLDGLPYLYLVMEYADQTLADVLQQRALADDEAQKMLRPTLEALMFLHGQNLVQGQLKPANILVVGDQLKLASDTIRRVSEGTLSGNAPTVYDPPESRDGSTTAAGDVWALGVCLFEALTRRPPPGRGEPGEVVALPADFSPAFRDVVARCLSPSPQNRPSLTELMASARGQDERSARETTLQPAATAASLPMTSESAPPRMTPPPSAPRAAISAPSVAQTRHPRALQIAMLGAFVVLALGWIAARVIQLNRGPAPAPSPSLERPMTQTPDAAAPVASDVPATDSTESPPMANRIDFATSLSALHEVLPEVPPSARQTINGHIKVWVRVIVQPDGSVLAATADRTGPSKYFERLAIDAAKQWTFPSAATQPERLIQIRFEFTRDGTTGHAVSLH